MITISLIITILMSPFIATLIYCLIQENKSTNCQRQQKCEIVNTENVYCYYPTLNQSRGMKKIAQPINKSTKKEPLNAFLEEYGKTIVKSLLEQESFIIPAAACQECQAELIDWLNKKKEIQFAVMEDDGIHVKKADVIL